MHNKAAREPPLIFGGRAGPIFQVAWLQGFLKDDGPAPSADVFDAAEGEGFKRKMVYDARRRANVQVRRTGGRDQGVKVGGGIGTMGRGMGILPMCRTAGKMAVPRPPVPRWGDPPPCAVRTMGG